MKNFDKTSGLKWQQKQESKSKSRESYYLDINKQLKRFSKNSFIDRTWWIHLSKEEKIKVYNSYQNTFYIFEKYKDSDKYWFLSDDSIIIEKGTWIEAIPEWVEFISKKYPEDLSVRREIALKKIL